MRQVLSVVLAVVCNYASAEKYNQVVKCCQPGWELSEEQDFRNSSIKCVLSEQENKLRINLLDESSEISETITTGPTLVCGGLRIKHHGSVEEIYSDGFVLQQGYEKPYACVDFKRSPTLDKPVAANTESKYNLSSESEPHVLNKEAYALFCPPTYQPCRQGDSCVDKCCRGSKVLKISEESKELECAAASDESEWTPENIDISQLQLNSLTVRSSFFYIKRRKKVCNIPTPVYQLGDKGRLEVLQEKDNFTQVISSFCIDNLQKEDGGPVAEVIVTDPGDCLDVVSFSEDTEEEEDDLKFEKLILIIISPISLFCIAVTGLVYLGKTFLRSPDNQKEKDKIILVNVFFSGLFYTYYVLFQHTNHSTFHVDCSNVVCSLVRRYACSLLGYSFYFVLMSNFTWVSVFGLDLYLSVHKLGGRPASEKKFFGLSVQLPLIVPVFLLALAASKFTLSNHNNNDNNDFVDDFLDVHHVALASLVTCIFGLLLLSVDLLRNCLSEERGPAESINSIVGLGLPLLLTAILASLHLLVPKDTQLNPQVGEQTQCVVIPQRPLTRFLLLYHLPIFSIVCANLFLFGLIIREIFGTRSSVPRNIDSKTELKKQMLLYIKIFTIFGLTWSLEPVGTVLESLGLTGFARVVATIANILNLLRGVFIFIIFVPSRLKKWWQRSCNPAPPGRRRQLNRMQTLETGISLHTLDTGLSRMDSKDTEVNSKVERRDTGTRKMDSRTEN